jgi:hypothetical protein
LVRDALIAIGLVCSIATTQAVHAQEAVVLRLPECASPDVDVELLRALLRIELGDAETPIEVSLGPSLCGDVTEPIEAVIGIPAASVSRSETFAIPGELDARSRARALALAIAERARLVATSLPSAAPDPIPSEPSADDDALASDRADALAPPEPVSPEVAPPRLPATFGLALRGRVAPVLPSWALGLRADVAASLDPTWSLRGEIVGTWSRGSAPEGDSDAVVIGAAGALGLSIWRDASFELALAVRAEAGLLVAIGTLMGGTPGRTTLHPWGTLGGELGIVGWLTPGLALVADVGVSAIVFGTQVVSAPSGTQIDLTVVTIDLDAGFRIAL